mgnify:CR=1 FL=1
MTLHLIKLCVGVDSVDQLASIQADRLDCGDRLIHVTRHRPKRVDEILAGGSLYWVIRNKILVRQGIIGLEPLVDEGGVQRCAIILNHELVSTIPKIHRPHQGWRYLNGSDAPEDFLDNGEGNGLPMTLVANLRDLGLI